MQTRARRIAARASVAATGPWRRRTRSGRGGIGARVVTGKAAPPSWPAAVAGQGEAVGTEHAVLDRLALGVLVVGADSLLAYANAAARQALVAGTAGLRLVGDRVGPLGPSLDREWRDALAAARRGEARTLRLPGHPAMTVAPWAGAGNDPRVICTLAICESTRRPGLRAWARAHGLTDAESEVLQGLARGEPPKSIARLRGSSEATVRSQVKSILLKTGHHGLRELVVAVLCAAPMPRAK